MNMKRISFKLFCIVTALILGFINANAALTVDVTNSFSQAITGTQQVYAEVTYKDNYQTGAAGSINGGFCINSNSFATTQDLNKMDVVVYFTDAGLKVANADKTGYITNANIIPGNGALVKFWFLIDVPNKRFKVYAQTGAMIVPELISTDYSAFRYGVDATAIGLLNYSAYRNVYEANPMTVGTVEVRDYNSVIPGITTFIPTVNNNSDVEVFQTSINGLFKVRSNETGIKSIQIYSIEGKLVKQITSNSKEETFELNQTGIYIVNVNYGDKMNQFKILKK